MRLGRIGWLGAVAVLGTACGGGGERFLSIGTGGTGGIYYPLGGALASRMSARDSLRQYTAEVTGGSVENINRIVAGEMDLGFTMATNAYEAYAGGDGLNSLRLAAPLYPNLVHVLVRDGTGITGVADFRGRRVAVGSAGSGTEQVSRHLLESAGLSYDDVEERYLSFRESADALRDGAIDAAVIAAGFPASAVLEIATAGVGHLIPIGDAARQTMADAYPYYSEAILPVDAYPGVDAPLATVSVLNWIVVDESLDATVVELLLQVLTEDRAALERVHSIAKQIDLSVLGRRTPIPLHPAAAAWAAAR